MKITISYISEEEQKAKTLLHFLLSFLADSMEKVRESDLHAPYNHIYLTTRKPGKASGSR